MHITGFPSFSRRMASRITHVVHEPQSPRAKITTSPFLAFFICSSVARSPAGFRASIESRFKFSLIVSKIMSALGFVLSKYVILLIFLGIGDNFMLNDAD